MHTSLTHARVSGWGFGVVVMTCAPHGNVAHHSKDTSTCTLLYLETSGFRGGVSGWGFGVGFRGFGVGFRGGVLMTCAPHGNVARHSKDTSTCTLLYLETSGFRGEFRGGASGWGFGVGFRGFGVGFRGFGVGFRGFGVGSWWHALRMETWHATARTLPHAQSSIWRLQGFGVGFRGGVVMTCAPHANVARHSKDTSSCTLLYLETSGFRGGVSGWGFGVGLRGGVSGFRGGVVSGWGRDAVRSAWKRGTIQQGHFHMHTPLFGDFRVSAGFGVGFRAFGLGFRGGVVMPCAPHGNVARHSKDTSTCTLLYLETSGFRDGVSGWGREDVRPAWKRGTPQQRHFHMHTPLFADFRVSGWGFGVGFRGGVSGFRGGVSGWGRDAVRSAWKRGTPQQGHFHMHTPLFGDFRVSGWGVGVGFRGGVVMPCAPHGHGMWNQHSKQTRIALENTGCYPQLRSFSFFALQNIYSEVL